MNTTRLIRGGSVLVALGLFTWAHHVDTPLSHVSGKNVVSQVEYLVDSGVPAIAVGAHEIDTHGTFAMAEGDSFSIRTADGAMETITFEAGDFADFASVSAEEVIDVIAAKSTMAEALLDNSHSVLRGMVGGGDASLELIDGFGLPLERLGLEPGVRTGSADLVMDLSIPHEDDHHGRLMNHDDLALHPYVLVASTTEGSFQLKGVEVPVGLDVTTMRVLGASRSPQLLPGFRGTLDENGDAQAVMSRRAMRTLLGGRGGRAGFPDQAYFAYVVFSQDMSEVEFVSNRFTVDFE